LIATATDFTRYSGSVISQRGEEKMPQYRAYFIDAKHIVRPPDVLVCDDDEAAIARARSLVSASDIELWHLDRLVFRFPRSAGAPA
jgi:hypothetical protein